MAIAELYDFGKIVLVSPYMSCCSLRGGGAGPLQRAAARCVRGSRFDFFAVRKLKNLERLRAMETLIICGEEDETINPINSLVRRADRIFVAWANHGLTGNPEILGEQCQALCAARR